MSGKGSTPRPIPDREGFERNFDAINWNTRNDPVQSDDDAPRLPSDDDGHAD